ncbi:MAG TPA: lipase family protein [Fimbriiglobus sp.]|nr:lipase family protein [Fimbriiglobus sp.]
MNLPSALKVVTKGLAKEIEDFVVPVKLQQMYKGYQLRDVTLPETRMDLDFLVTLAELADHIYLTGTKAAHSAEGSPFGISLRHQLGELFQNYMQLFRFDATTGLVIETMGPFGAVVASAVPPGLERVPVAGRSAAPPRYRLFVVFRGTVPAVGDLYLDDLSTDAKTVLWKARNTVGNKDGDVARGFHNTYVSCRSVVVGQLIPRAMRILSDWQAKFLKESAPKGRVAGAPRRLGPADVQLYVVGHSLGGAVATLCAYDIACRLPAYNPVLVTFGSPAVGDIDFAIGFNKVMVERNRYHPQAKCLRSIRVEARTNSGDRDPVTATDVLPNYIHVNSRLPLTAGSGITSRFGAHSMTDSYTAALKALQK